MYYTTRGHYWLAVIYPSSDLFACKSPSIILTLSITDPGVGATLIFLGPINNLVLAVRTWRGLVRRRFVFGGETGSLIVDGCE